MAYEGDSERGLLYRIANALIGINKTQGTAAITSSTIATSGATATIAFSATSRVEILNPSTATLWASWGTPAVNGAGSFPINPGGSYAPGFGVVGTLTLLSTAANQPYTANRFV